MSDLSNVCFGVWNLLWTGVCVCVTRAKHRGECVETAGRSGRSGKGFKKGEGCCGIWNLEFAVDGCRCVCYQSETQRGARSALRSQRYITHLTFSSEVTKRNRWCGGAAVRRCGGAASVLQSHITHK